MPHTRASRSRIATRRQYAMPTAVRMTVEHPATSANPASRMVVIRKSLPHPFPRGGVLIRSREPNHSDSFETDSTDAMMSARDANVTHNRISFATAVLLAAALLLAGCATLPALSGQTTTTALTDTA